MAQINNSELQAPNSSLPPGWRWVKLGEVIQEALPGFACGKRAGPDGFIQLRMNNISTHGQIDLSSILRVPATQDQVEKYKVVPGDVIFNNTNSVELVGKTALFNEPKGTFLYSNHLTRLRSIPEVLEASFLASWLQLQWYQRVFEITCNRWIGQAAVQREKLLDFKIPLPPLPEQMRIATKIQELMQEVKRARTACEKQLEAAKSLSSAYLREVFESEESKKWEKKKLGEVCLEVYRYPTYYNINYVSEGVPEIRGELIREKGGLETDLTQYRFISKETSEKYPRTKLKEGDFVLSVRGSMGKVALITKEFEGANITANLIRISPNGDSVYSPFLKMVFLSEYFQTILNDLSPQTTIKTIKAPILKSIIIPLPSMIEQKRISSELEEKMEGVLELQSFILDEQSALDSLPQAILRKAFRGEL
jgi:type I restriction enzyme S subunit